MEEYWNPNEPEDREQPEAETAELFEQSAEENVPEEQPEELFAEEEPPKPKKKRSFKKRVHRAVRRFLRLPLLTKIIAIAAVAAILAAIILMIVILPRNCKPSTPASTAPSASPSAAVSEPTDTPAPTDEPIVTATPFIIPALTGNLKLNDTNAAVVPYVRQKLVELGYLADPGEMENPGLYDQDLVNAVKRFQYRNFYNDYRAWDGIIGQSTYELLTSSSAKAFFMRKGDTDDALFDGKLVTALQEKLIQLNYLKIAATGNYDDATYEAVKSFQRANSLSADGIAGLRTLQLVDTLIENPQMTPAPTGTDVIVSDTSAPTA